MESNVNITEFNDKQTEVSIIMLFLVNLCIVDAVCVCVRACVLTATMLSAGLIVSTYVRVCLCTCVCVCVHMRAC